MDELKTLRELAENGSPGEFECIFSPDLILSLLYRLEKAPQWISLADQKPPEWRHVIVALDTGAVVIGVRGSAGWHWDETDNEADAEANATHWMPFPAHPAAVAQLDKQEKK
jgi:hypothetical protein